MFIDFPLMFIDFYRFSIVFPLILRGKSTKIASKTSPSPSPSGIEGILLGPPGHPRPRRCGAEKGCATKQ